MFPGLPTSLNGDLVIGDVDEECQARVVTKHGQPFGAWLDAYQQSCTDAGVWTWRAVGTGLAQAAERGSFLVAPTTL